MSVDPVLAGLLDELDDDGGAPIDLEELRAGLDRFAAAVARPGQPVAQVIDDVVAGVPVRRYRPAPVTPAGLQLVWAHGGGWIAGSLNAVDPLCRALAVAAGVEVVSVGYRLAPEHPFPAALDDVLAVVDAMDGPLAVGGDSAGGGLAAVVAQVRPGRLAAQVLVTPLLDATLSSPSITSLGSGHGLTRNALERYVALYLDGAAPTDLRASPLLAPDLRGLPPTVVVTAAVDPLRDEGSSYAARLQSAGVPVRHRCWPAMVHGFMGMSAHTPLADQAVDWTAARLQELACGERIRSYPPDA